MDPNTLGLDPEFWLNLDSDPRDRLSIFFKLIFSCFYLEDPYSDQQSCLIRIQIHNTDFDTGPDLGLKMFDTPEQISDVDHSRVLNLHKNVLDPRSYSSPVLLIQVLTIQIWLQNVLNRIRT